jgi:hypothetical protein
VEQNRLEEERLAKESLKAARMEESKSSEVGPGKLRLPERNSSLSARDSSNNHGQQRRRESGRHESQSRSSKSSEYFLRTV